MLHCEAETEAEESAAPSSLDREMAPSRSSGSLTMVSMSAGLLVVAGPYVYRSSSSSVDVSALELASVAAGFVKTVDALAIDTRMFGMS